jgi:hypothetical protein
MVIGSGITANGNGYSSYVYGSAETTETLDSSASSLNAGGE